MQLRSILARAVELRFDQSLLGLQRFGRLRVSAVGGGQLLAQVRLDLARGVGFEPQPVALALALGEHAVLLGEPHFQIGQPPAEDLRLRGLTGELALEVRDPLPKLVDLPTLLG